VIAPVHFDVVLRVRTFRQGPAAPTSHAAKVSASCWKWSKEPCIVKRVDCTRYRPLELARVRPSARVKTKEQPFRVRVVDERLHAVGKTLRVGGEVARGVARAGPAVVEDEVGVAEVAKGLSVFMRGDKCISDGVDFFLVAAASALGGDGGPKVEEAAVVVCAPRVPAHGRLDE
jgi:hypothetical protein